VTFPVRLDGAGPLRVKLHTEDGGAKIASDPRTLNFRVFRCEIESASGVASKMRAELVQTRAAQSWTSRMGRGLRLLKDVCFSSAQIRVPMSQRQIDRLHLRQDGGGIAFFAGPLTGLFRRGSSALPGAMLGPNLNVVWGDGWYAAETFRGETFRWMRQSGEMSLVLPAGGASEISLLVENGPAVGFAPVEVEIRDQWGTLLTKATVNGRTLVKVPIRQAKWAVTLSLTVHGGGPAKEIPGDSRVMALRLRRVECTAALDADTASTEPAETMLRSGVWCTRGWRRHGRGSAGISMFDSADLALRPQEEGPSRLTLGLVAPEGPVELRIKDGNDRELFRGRIQGTQEVAISGEYAGLCALHFVNETETQPLTLMSVSWAAGSGPASRLTVRANRGRDLAVHLHTNACGDFTMLAREHWMDLRGYAELDVFSMNVDALFCWTAHHGGAPEQVLASPMRIFHIEHATGSGWTPEGENKLYERIAAKGIPWLNYDDVVQWARTMNSFDAPIIFNHENWGLAADELQEARPKWSERAGAP
jgi:hypothetical protein